VTRWLAALVVFAGILGACNSNLGLGEPDCRSPDRGVSPANILTIQAVPTAKYTPCLNGLRLGWDSVAWSAESGRAGFEILEGTHPFLAAVVSESCDTSDTTEVESGYSDIRRFEEFTYQDVEIEVMIVPSGQRPLLRAGLLVAEYAGVELDDRPVVFAVDDHMEEPVSSRVNLALMRNQYVWIIGELDAEESTVELRSNDAAVSGRGLSPEDALDQIEDHVAEVYYRGNWYFTFDGGCIAYEFDATGVLAETVADDAELAIGFYPASEVRSAARDAGFSID